MYSSVDNYDDLNELIDEDDIADGGNDAQLFAQATTYVQSAVATIDNTVLLKLYAHYKQAIEGACSTENRPSWYNFHAKSKYEAWSALGAMPKTEARSKYIEIVQSLGQDLTRPNRDKETDVLQVKSAVGWVTHSTLQQYGEDPKDEVCADPNMKTLLDLISSNDLLSVAEHLAQYPDLVSGDCGRDRLTPAHYAADRGVARVLAHILSEHGVIVDARDADGQTPLHYASACGHSDCCTVLLGSGADVTALDNDGKSCLDVAADDDIKQLLIAHSS